MSRLLKEITDWPERAGASGWRLKQMAATLNVSARTLRRWIKREFGMNAKRWLAELQKAHVLQVRRIETCVTNAAVELKYNNLNNFSRDFKKMFGFCPSKLPPNGLPPSPPDQPIPPPAL